MNARSRTQEHVGEWKLTIAADSLEDLFAEAANVVARACGPTEGAPGEWETVSLEARDMATLVADWINELIGRSEISGQAYRDVRVVAIREAEQKASIEAEIRGRQVRTWRSPLKAATYHGLTLERSERGARATVLIDV